MVTDMSQSIVADPHRQLPLDPQTRDLAARLLGEVENLPIISPHGHVDPTMLEANAPFPDPASLLISPDHYVTRLIHACGVPMEELVGDLQGNRPEPREVWRHFCRHWPAFDGTATGYWLSWEFVNVFGIDDSTICAENADDIFDTLNERLKDSRFRPRQLFADFNIEALATTDDPLDDLQPHANLNADASFPGRIMPTFRPDAYVKIDHPDFVANVQHLISQAGDGLDGYEGYIRALANRRQYFIDNGAVSTDHSPRSPLTLDLDPAEARALFDKGMKGDFSADDAAAFEAHMMFEMARMAVDDGLVMTMHPGIYRNHHSPTFQRFGGDTGHDIPLATGFTRELQPMLSAFGTEPGFHFVPFTVDETVYSREIAPLAGFYPSVYIGAPWWFLDAPDAMLRFRAAVTETAGFTRSAGFVDDTRAFCSIPARHDASRRSEAAFLARYVRQHRISEERAAEIIVDLVDSSPRRVFKL